jgi:hypothetical protein
MGGLSTVQLVSEPTLAAAAIAAGPLPLRLPYGQTTELIMQPGPVGGVNIQVPWRTEYHPSKLQNNHPPTPIQLNLEQAQMLPSLRNVGWC